MPTSTRVPKKLKGIAAGFALLIALATTTLGKFPQAGQPTSDSKSAAAKKTDSPPEVKPASKLPVILLTGFEPFGEDRSANPSWEGIKNLDNVEWRGHLLVAMQLKVVWGQPIVQLEEAIKRLQPAAIFSFGQGGSEGFALECRASNARAGYPDNEERLPPAPNIVEGGPAEFAASNDNAAIARQLASSGFRIRLSKAAGQYLCEEALYSLEYLRIRHSVGAVGFAHVPPLNARVGGDRVDGPYVERFVRAYLEAWHQTRKGKKPATSLVLQADRDAFLDELATIIAASIVRKDTKHAVFHGCIDWHSAVHGHWALLRLARATGRFADESRMVAGRLTSKAVDREAKDLEADARFEMPYGRAWFLRLAIEFEAYQAERKAAAKPFSAMADEIAKSLAKFVEATPSLSPDVGEYANHSWAVVQLHDFLLHRGDFEGLKRLDAIVDAKFVKSKSSRTFADDRSSGEFFSPFGNWAYLIARTQRPATMSQFLAERQPALASLEPVDPLVPGAHHLGIHWSRAWALRALAARSVDVALQRRCREAFDQHVAAGVAVHRRHRKDYWAYGHWVPQFAVYALTE